MLDMEEWMDIKGMKREGHSIREISRQRKKAGLNKKKSQIIHKNRKHYRDFVDNSPDAINLHYCSLEPIQILFESTANGNEVFRALLTARASLPRRIYS